MKLIFVGLSLLAFLLAIIAELGLGFALPGKAEGAGIGIRMLALIDVALLWTVGALVAEIVLQPGRLMRAQGIVMLVASILGVLGGLALIFATLVLLILMVSLLVAAPFGTIAYLAAWGDFPAQQAGVALALVMTLKLLGAGFLLAASPAILKNKGLLVLLGFSIGSTFVTGLLIALVPGVVAAIADVIGALISAVLGTVWLVVMLIGAILAIIRMIRSVAPG